MTRTARLAAVATLAMGFIAAASPAQATAIPRRGCDVTSTSRTVVTRGVVATYTTVTTTCGARTFTLLLRTIDGHTVVLSSDFHRLPRR